MKKSFFAVLTLVVSSTICLARAVDADKLKAHLPSEVGGIAQNKVDATSDGGTCVATAIYVAKDGSKDITLIVTDYADPEIAAAIADWAKKDVNETKDGATRRTGKIGGFRSLEEYNTEGKYGSINIMVSDHMILMMNYSQLTEADAIAAAEKLPLKELAGMK